MVSVMVVLDMGLAFVLALRLGVGVPIHNMVVKKGKAIIEVKGVVAAKGQIIGDSKELLTYSLNCLISIIV